MSWGDELSLALGALKSPPDQAAKKVFIADLKANYGDIAALNAAWGTSHASWTPCSKAERHRTSRRLGKT